MFIKYPPPLSYISLYNNNNTNMSDLDPDELLYVAGIGLFLNILVFAVTLLISWCHPEGAHGSSSDIEAASPSLLSYQNGENDSTHDPLLGDRGSGLVDLIPEVKFGDAKKEERESSTTGLGCCICLREKFEDEDICKVLPECNHVFHSECIDQWLKKKQSCPVCRKNFLSLIVNQSSV